MWSLVRRIYWIIAVILISGCSGGGCSGCAGGAIQPIHGGYPLTPETRIPRAAQVRLTENGLRRVEMIAPGLFSGFLGTGIPVPSSSQNLTVGRVVICPSGRCTITVTLPTAPPPLQLGLAEPNAISARVRIVARGTIPLRACVGSCSDSCGGTFCGTIASPDIEIDTSQGNHGFIGLSTNAAIRRDTHPPRLSYHRVDLVSPTGMGDVIQETPSEGIEDADIRCTGSWICGIVNLLRGTIIGQFRGQFAQALGPIQGALSQSAMPDPPGCPPGTTVRDGKCQYSDNTPVPSLLGTDGTGNFGALLGSIVPGLNARSSFLLAAGDPMTDAQVLRQGLTVNLFGAFQSAGHATCVPRVAAPMIPTVPEFQVFRNNIIPGSTTTMDLGIGLSEDYLNYAGYQMWDSGLFCLGVGTGLSQQLSAGTFGALITSLRQVIFPQTSASIAITLRPQTPPTFRVGSGRDIMTDPLLTLRFNRLALDFYAWSEERYVRFMTVNTDLSLPINLQADTMGLRPTLGTLRTDNTMVSNNQLLSNNPAALAMVLQSLLGPVIGMAAGALPTINLPSIPVPGAGGMSIGTVNIRVPTGGVQGVTEGPARALGIFANLQFTPAGRMPETVELDTAATLESLSVDNRFFRDIEFLNPDHLPRVAFTASTPNTFGHTAEYSYRIDQGAWSTFTTNPRFELQDPAFATVGPHTIEVRARIEATPDSADQEPARIAFVIDPNAPTVTARFDGNTVIASANDDFSSAVEYALQVGDAPRGPWGSTDRFTVPTDATRVTVFARDQNGNEASAALQRNLTAPGQEELIRGGPSTDGSSGCGCTVEGTGSQGNALAAIAGLLGLMALLRRRQSSRRAHTAAPVMLTWPLAFGAAGCSCDETVTTSMMPPPPVTCSSPQVRCASSNMCVTPPSCPMCMPGFAPAGSPTFDAATCRFATTACMCQRLAPLTQGAAGSFLRMAAAANGTLWLSGYSEGDASEGTPYGDLIVGRWLPEMSTVQWTHVDGVPADGMVTGDPDGWRGGIGSAGENVGRFNSIALGSDNNPRVAYYDDDHAHLKFASFDGTRWTTHTVDENGVNGRYTSLVMLPGNIPAIAYRAVAVMGQNVNAVVRLARANSATPTRASDWTITDVSALPSACRASDCPMGSTCTRPMGRCVPAGTCAMPCGAGQACAGGMCVDAYAAGWVESLPPGALFINLAVDAMGRLAVVWYNRDRGNLMLAQGDAMGRFMAPVILDGEGAMTRDTGDRGIYASAAFGRDGALHVAYVDGWEERLMYLRVMNGAPMGAPEMVDDGAQVGPMTFDDGRHIVGDSASIAVADDGTVRVAYQDSTVGTLRLATRGAMGWTRSIVDRTNHTGYWASIAGGNVATWWRELSTQDNRQWGVRVFPIR